MFQHLCQAIHAIQILVDLTASVTMAFVHVTSDTMVTPILAADQNACIIQIAHSIKDVHEINVSILV